MQRAAAVGVGRRLRESDFDEHRERVAFRAGTRFAECVFEILNDVAKRFFFFDSFDVNVIGCWFRF